MTIIPVGQWRSVGVDYCTVHHGTRNEDDSRIDEDGRLTCEWYDDSPECDEDGNPLPCDLVPLHYFDGETDG